MRFLVLNADAERRDGLKTLLRQIARHAGYNDAPDNLQARRLLRRQRFDLVAIDWQDVRRLADLQVLCSASAPAPVAVLIDDVTPDIVHRLFDCGVAGVIPRSTQPHLIVRALEMVLLGGHYIPPSALDLAPASGAQHSDAHLQSLISKIPRRPASGLLSPRQTQIMRFVHMGSTNKMIARTLGISEGTVKIHLASIFQQLGATNRAAAVAIYNGWLPPHLEVLLSSRDATRKPALGERGPIPLRNASSYRRYARAVNEAMQSVPQAAEPPAPFHPDR
ncbi:helix-turn-helix transcriptional regulator [Burkholderia guangdongensis]|uniref:helix-turn-helix transcriptional regulator n=1 Tax=Burkholderia guangdongensis TaxID=1792500 RepID=UPI0015CA5CAB|nr:response regulator transcription factor [Burkholderia guangdongensis]